MIHRNGDLFTTDAQIIAHGANTQGVMGAGIAKTVKEKFPDNYRKYRQFCKDGLAVPGEWYGHSEPDTGLLIVNLFSQDKPGANARYGFVSASLLDFAELYNAFAILKTYGSVIAIPEIGSGIGGLEFVKVEKILQLVEDLYPSIEFEVWHYV